MLLLILINASPILIHALPILKYWVGFRVSAPYLNTHFICLYTLKRHHSASKQNRASENPRLLAANQNRVLHHPSRQPIWIEHYVTWELSVMLEDPSRLLALGSSRLVIAYLITYGLPSLNLISSHSYYQEHWMLRGLCHSRDDERLLTSVDTDDEL